MEDGERQAQFGGILGQLNLNNAAKISADLMDIGVPVSAYSCLMLLFV